MLPWIGMALVGALALVAGLFAASRAQAAAAAGRELESLKAELEATRGRAGKRADGDRKRDEELAELRRRLEKTKRRVSQAREDERQESERIRELEEKVRLAQADARAMHAELQRAEAEIERLREVPRPKPPVVVAPPPPQPVAKEPTPPEPPRDEALARRAAAAEAGVLALEEQLVAARVDAERQRRKAAAHDRLYVVLRGELDAKKERLRTQQEELERLRALRLVLADDLVDSAATAQVGAASEPAV
jgi:hypothetical protein